MRSRGSFVAGCLPSFNPGMSLTFAFQVGWLSPIASRAAGCPACNHCGESYLGFGRAELFVTLQDHHNPRNVPGPAFTVISQHCGREGSHLAMLRNPRPV